MNRRTIVKNAPLLLTSSTAFSFQANSAIRFGIIGTGGRGQYEREMTWDEMMQSA